MYSPWNESVMVNPEIPVGDSESEYEDPMMEDVDYFIPDVDHLLEAAKCDEKQVDKWLNEWWIMQTLYGRFQHFYILCI